jgi:hypothetical protein
MENKIYYCDCCAIKYKLPIRTGELYAGFCRLCGNASTYIGYITENEANELDIIIPPIENLSD